MALKIETPLHLFTVTFFILLLTIVPSTNCTGTRRNTKEVKGKKTKEQLPQVKFAKNCIEGIIEFEQIRAGIPEEVLDVDEEPSADTINDMLVDLFNTKEQVMELDESEYDQALEKMAECPDDLEMVKLLSRELLRTYEMDPS